MLDLEAVHGWSEELSLTALSTKNVALRFR